MLKENPRSLRQYFALIAIISLLPFLSAIVQGRWSLFASVPALVDLCLAGLFVYIAVRFYALLQTPTFILTVLMASAASLILNYGVRFMRMGVDRWSIANVAFALLVFWYLFRSVARLAREAAQGSA
jgi:uncharacterized membrane protein